MSDLRDKADKMRQEADRLQAIANKSREDADKASEAAEETIRRVDEAREKVDRARREVAVATAKRDETARKIKLILLRGEPVGDHTGSASIVLLPGRNPASKNPDDYELKMNYLA